MSDQFSIQLGALTDPISKQLTDQGIPYNAEEVARLEIHAKAISVAGINSYFTPSAVESARKKLVKRISQAIRKAK